MEKKDRYHLAIDGMRILAILAVVGIHTTTRILEASSFNFQGLFSIVLFFNQVSRFAVPLFFMISGFVLEVNYPFHQSYVSYLKKRLSKILIPYIFWSAIYYFFIYKEHTISFVQSLLDGSASYQLYFIPTLLIFYLIFPFIHTIFRFITNKWSLILLGIIQVILLIEDYYIRPIPFLYPFNIALLNYYIFLLGMVAAHHHALLLQFVNKWKWLFVFFFLVFSVTIFTEGKTLYLKTHNYLFFYSSWRPSVLLYTSVVFSFSYFLCNTLTLYEKFIRTISRLSFFVFFIHVAVLEFLWSVLGQNIFRQTMHSQVQQIWFGPVFFISIVSVSYLVAYFIQKIPFATKVSG